MTTSSIDLLLAAAQQVNPVHATNVVASANATKNTTDGDTGNGFATQSAASSTPAASLRNNPLLASQSQTTLNEIDTTSDNNNTPTAPPAAENANSTNAEQSASAAQIIQGNIVPAAIYNSVQNSNASTIRGTGVNVVS